MAPPPRCSRLSIEDLKDWMQAADPPILVDTLTNDHFKQVHLPRAKNACVFEVTFLDQIAALVPDDFFWADRFPTAAFTLEGLTPISGSHLTTPNYTVEGTLEMMGIGVYQQFPATLTSLPDQRLAAEAHFDIDRTHWNIIYGSSRFFDHLGMHVVFDLISVQLRLVTL